MRAGFTLLEGLIALVIASILTVLMLEMLANLTQNATRLSASHNALRLSVLNERPLRRALQNAWPAYHDAGALEGRSNYFRGQTIQGIGGASHPVEFELSIEFTEGIARLVYSEAGQGSIERELGVLQAAYFTYVDVWGEAHNHWPPEERHVDAPDYYRRVPALIEVKDSSAEVIAAYVITSHRKLPLRAQDFDTFF